MNTDDRLEQLPIVAVGVDGSEGARQALRCAVA